MVANTKAKVSIDSFEFDQGQVTFCVKGRTPLLMNRMSEKAKNELLLPAATGSKKKSGMPKHLPYEEFRGAAYKFRDARDTRLAIPANMFKGAMANAALDIPADINKSQVMRLVWVEGQLIELYGKPMIHSAIVNEGKYPNVSKNIRFRPILEQWACRLTVSFMQPNLNTKGVAKLLATAGVVAGVGDDRQQKGHGNHGQFELVDEDDEGFQAICEYGREEQEAALADPECYDLETEDLLSWYIEEYTRRGFDSVVSKSNGTGGKAAEDLGLN